MALYYARTVVDGGESSDPFVIQGLCDVYVAGLTTGYMKFQALFKGESDWVDLPLDNIEEDSYKTIFISEPQVSVRLTGVGNNDGVVVRLAKGLTR